MYCLSSSGTKPGDKKVYHKRKSSSSIWSSDNIPEIKISESNNSDVAESDETETEQGSRRAGSADTVIEINEKRERKVDSPGVFKSSRRLHNSGENAEKKEKNGERRRKDIEGSNGEKRHKKRKKMESAQSVEVTDDRHGSGILEDLRRYTHSPGGGLGRKHRLKKLSKENLDKLQVQIEMEEEDKHNLIRRKPTESSSDIEEIDEKAGNNRNKRKARKDDVLTAKEGNLQKADSLDVEYRNLSREFISPKRKQLLKQLKYKNRRYQIYCDDVGMSRSLEHDCDSLGAPRQDENKSKSLNFLLEQR